MVKNLGKKIRELRKTRGMTLVDLAKKTGIAQATLSRIETGVMTGTVESHEKITEALGLGLGDFYAAIDSRFDEIHHATREAPRRVTRQDRGVQVELLTQESARKKITPLLVTLARHTHTHPETLERGVEKFLYQLEGEIRVKVAGEDISLKPGETLYFDASLTHQIGNSGEKASRTLVAVSPSQP